MKKQTALIYSFASILCWAVSPVLIRYVKDYFSVSFQNFFRFAVSIVILWVFTILTIGLRKFFGSLKEIRNPVPKLLLIALCNFLHQFFLIKGVYLLMPGLVTIVEESTIIFAAALAFIFLPGERKLILRPVFIIGLLMAVGGVVITAVPELSSDTGVIAAAPVRGMLYVFISSLAWASFSLMIKLWLPEVPSAVTSSLVFTLVIPLFLISMIAETGPGILQPDVPGRVWLLLAVSGVVGIGLGYSFYYQSIKGLGVTLTSSLSLLIPAAASVISFFIFGETLAPVQLAGTAILLSGCFLIVRTRFSL